MRHDGWRQLLAHDDYGGCLIPMMMLHHEHDEDPDMRPKPIGPEQREKVISSMTAGLMECGSACRLSRSDVTRGFWRLISGIQLDFRRIALYFHCRAKWL
jgi:hypothetical protein